MKDKLMKMLTDKEAQRSQLVEKSKTSQDVNELRSISTNLDGLNAEIKELREMLTSLEGSGFRPMGSYGMNPEGEQREEGKDSEDIYSSLEYRQAFKDYVTKNKPIPDQFKASRAEPATVLADIGAVIPTTIMNRVIEESKAYGMILSRVTQSNYVGGVEIPISELRPTATWINETTPSNDKKMDFSDKITFGYHLLECRVSLGLISATVSLPIFEQTIIKNIKEAMIIAQENAIINGSGNGQPKGILMETIASERQLSLDGTEIKTVEGWAKAEAALPLAYEGNSVYIMAKSTWEKYLNGATDTSGQKLGFISISDNQKRILNGREVILTDYIKGYDTATTGDVVAVIVDLENYFLNSNMTMSYKRYFDEDNNKYVHKAIAIVDGKMADKNGLILIKKG